MRRGPEPSSTCLQWAAVARGRTDLHMVSTSRALGSLSIRNEIDRVGKDNRIWLVFFSRGPYAVVYSSTLVSLSWLILSPSLSLYQRVLRRKMQGQKHRRTHR
ncbi:hypothetical protein SCHPADRAFT_685490 [Schizopora paradoxa]|uniref:Uncharacterized protein n=1 Tax=Schizopora paradoxa TaxID=27342 RepID=A0A0H2R487_9AGAM|nr:hypothetical protein SCHPADRAFT_685490 [Schizopora paradoxa]